MLQLSAGASAAALGIEARAAALAKAAPHKAGDVTTALFRLTGAEAMGSLFKVLGLVGPDWPQGVGFDDNA